MNAPSQKRSSERMKDKGGKKSLASTAHVSHEFEEEEEEF